MQHPAKRRFAGPAGALAAAAALALTAAPAQADQGLRPLHTVQVSVGVGGAKPNGQSQSGAVSADGRYALFTSAATDLVAQPSTSQGGTDAYVRDLDTNRTERVSLADDGSALGGTSSGTAISADGRFVAFETDAPGVVPGAPAPGRVNVYVRDRRTGHTDLVSAPHGAPDTDLGHYAWAASISADGRYVAYVSDRTDLVGPAKAAGEQLTTPNHDSTVYLTDRWTHTTRVVSATAAGTAARGESVNATISADGRYVGFSSNAPDLFIPGAPHRTATTPQLSLGQMIQGTYYVYDTTTRAIVPTSYDTSGQVTTGATLDATLSPSGRYVVYGLSVPVGAPDSGQYENQIFARDLKKGTLIPLTAGLPGTVSTAGSDSPQVTADDHWVYFDSFATNLVPGPKQHDRFDVYRYDLNTGRVERITDAPDGSPGNGDSDLPHVDAHGRTVLFESTSRNLVPGQNGPAEPSNIQVFAKH
ncbi:hypothetical protein [Kitasatospora sp. NPDC101183]|uniref:hypothetical protein n=1 Tax=Kitasatospora sp. NPDC101183 TaxID=3364100 RepID=UPI003821AB71